MAKAPATEVQVGERTVRISNPDRVYFPASGATKIDLVEYYLAVEPGIMRALRDRPTTLERWPKGVHPGIVLSTREKGVGDAFFGVTVTSEGSAALLAGFEGADPDGASNDNAVLARLAL